MTRLLLVTICLGICLGISTIETRYTGEIVADCMQNIQIGDKAYCYSPYVGQRSLYDKAILIISTDYWTNQPR